MLKEPADWRMENLPIPPGFAPTIRFRGLEEIRFAPGMFKPGASDYFTCVIAIVADEVAQLGATELTDLLQKYYRGLSGNRAQRTGAKVDISQMNATVQPLAGDQAQNHFEAQIDFFDTFSDGRKITLNIEARVFPKSATRSTTLLLLVSPSAKDSPTWTTLHQIEDKTLSGMGEH